MVLFDVVEFEGVGCQQTSSCGASNLGGTAIHN